MNQRVIEGLRLVLKEREKALYAAVQTNTNVYKKNETTWRTAHDLADHALIHAEKIMDAVNEFRETDRELTELIEKQKIVKPVSSSRGSAET